MTADVAAKSLCFGVYPFHTFASPLVFRNRFVGSSSLGLEWIRVEPFHAHGHRWRAEFRSCWAAEVLAVRSRVWVVRGTTPRTQVCLWSVRKRTSYNETKFRWDAWGFVHVLYMEEQAAFFRSLHSKKSAGPAGITWQTITWRLGGGYKHIWGHTIGTYGTYYLDTALTVCHLVGLLGQYLAHLHKWLTTLT